MNVPCLMGLRCAHCICDDDGDPVCCHPYTIDTIDEERWAKAEGLCVDMTECPLVREDSDLEYLLRFGSEYNPEEWASYMAMLRVAVHRCDRTNVSLDSMKEEVSPYVLGLWLEMIHGEIRQRREGE